jgi:transcriptional regulator with XRE-family HTH domain
MVEKKISPQSKRLKTFINETGLSYSEFARQCKIPQTRSITAICSDGKVPTAKILEKIIKRFPQLNYDWVFLGYGEMIVQGMQKQPATSDSLKKSRDASYENIQEYLENHDYALNNLANKVEKAILSATKTFQQVNDRLTLFEEKLEIVNLEVKQNWKKYEAKIDSDLGEFGKTIEKEFNSIREDSLAARAERFKLTNELDDKRLKYLHDKFEEIKADLKENSDANTLKAMKFVSEIGDFKKHFNPKPEK